MIAKRTLIGAAGLMLLVSGCVQTRQTQPKRTAVEQLLISRAADHAMAEANLSELKGKRVYLDEQYYFSEDGKYALGTIRDFISLAGGLLVDHPDDSEVIVEARSGALSIDSGDTLVGFPEMPIPIPLSGTVSSPEVPFYKAERQYSVAKLALLVYDTKTRAHLFSTGTLIGKSHHHYFKLLGFFSWTNTELPEKK